MKATRTVRNAKWYWKVFAALLVAFGALLIISTIEYKFLYADQSYLEFFLEDIKFMLIPIAACIFLFLHFGEK